MHLYIIRILVDEWKEFADCESFVPVQVIG